MCAPYSRHGSERWRQTRLWLVQGMAAAAHPGLSLASEIYRQQFGIFVYTYINSFDCTVSLNRQRLI